jgi:FixJ family two-component response regulator
MAKTRPVIAIVDDEESVRKAFARLMRSTGLAVETFDSGAEFLKSVETRRPDCLVLDLHMPEMNGFAVQTHLTKAHPAVPVIIMTGHDSPNDRERAMEHGASGFLRKPVDERALLEAISTAVANANGNNPLGDAP